MKLSVVIPTHGRRDLLERTLRSLDSDADGPEVEVHVVDDGADAELDQYVAALPIRLRVDVVSHPECRGRSVARNSGIDRATGEVLVFLDGDMEVVPGFLAAHASEHSDGNTVALGTIVTTREIRHDAFVRYVDSRGVRKVKPGERIPGRYFLSGNSSVSRPLLDRAGGFDEGFAQYGGEDTEMGYRLEQSGARFVHAADAVSVHLDLKGVVAMARRLRVYGETTLPLLVQKAPQAGPELRLDLVHPDLRGESTMGTRMLSRVARIFCRRTFWEPAAHLAAVLPGFVRADALFDFVRASAYLDGYRQHLEKTR